MALMPKCRLAGPMEYLHLEHDGKLLLVDEQGVGPLIPVPGRSECNEGWTMRLPTVEEVAEMGIEWSEKRRNLLNWGQYRATVIHGLPHIDWPEHWAWKDDLIGDSAVHPAARESVYRTMHRLVSKVMIIDVQDRVVMAKVKRGHFVGAWTLPGGYLDYGENPGDGAVREAMEELGIDISLSDERPVISQNIFTEEGINFVSFTYRSQVDAKTLQFALKADEIEEVGWFSKDEALARAASWFDKSALHGL